MTARPAALLTALTTLALLAVPAAGQDRQRAKSPAPQTVPATGSELFRGLFAYQKIDPVTPDKITDYGELIVVLLGRQPDGGRWPDIVKQALQAGGSVLIASDRQASLGAQYFPDRTRVEITGERVRATDRFTSFNGLEDCPFIVPRQPATADLALWRLGSGAPGPEWGLFAPWQRLATNRPSAIRVPAYGQYARYALAGFPPSAAVGDVSPLPEDRLFAVGASGAGKQATFRSLILADPSVFSNQMIAGTREEAPTDNFLFANAVVMWLSDGGRRKKCLFVEAGEVRDRFDDVRYAEISPPIPPLPVPPLPSPLDPELQRRLAEGVNRAVANLEDNDALNRALTGGPHNDRRFSNTMRTLAAIAAVLAVLWLLRRVWQGRHEPDLPPVPKDTGRVAASGPPGSVARRREEILQAGNYTDVVREYLRELFAERGLGPPPGADPPKKMPAVEATGRDAGAIRGHLRILWDVAFAASPRPVTYSRWKELEPMIDAVRRAADDGRWRFAPGGPA